MTEKKEHATESMKPRQGHPHVPAQMARPNRVVTFVTDQELQSLKQTVIEEDRSLAYVVHRIIAAHFKEN